MRLRKNERIKERKKERKIERKKNTKNTSLYMYTRRGIFGVGKEKP